jgi:hypothetical protein
MAGWISENSASIRQEQTCAGDANHQNAYQHVCQTRGFFLVIHFNLYWARGMDTTANDAATRTPGYGMTARAVHPSADLAIGDAA